MLGLDIKLRNEIVKVLSNVIVPAQDGAVLMQIVKLLSELKEVEIPKKDVPPTPIQPK
jgi:hypothetical protein